MRCGVPASAGGSITALGGTSDLLELMPQAAPHVEEHWRGLSGAPVFCDKCLVGLVTSGPKRAAGQRLWAIPIERLFQDKDFRNLVGNPPIDWVPHVEGLEDPFVFNGKPKGPAQLLDARYRVVPFVWEVRQKESEILTTWCDSDDPVSAVLFTGPGGAGKTRLLAEWCREKREAGWRTGFVKQNLGPGVARSMVAGHSDSLLVIDYAERRGLDELRRVLSELVENVGPKRVRIALLARTHGDWWSVLKEHGEQSRVRELLEAAGVVEMSDLTLQGEERQLVFNKAFDAYAKFKVVTGRLPPAWNLSNERFERPLYVQMAALASAEALNLQAKEKLEAKDLLDETLKHEERFWATLFPPPGATAREIRRCETRVRQCVAAITLRGGVSEEQNGRTLFERVSGASNAEAQRIWDTLNDLQPSKDGGLESLQPDLLGEALVRNVLGAEKETSSFLHAVFEPGCDATTTQSGFTLLGGIELSGEGRSKEWMRTLLAADVSLRAIPGFQAALTLGTRSAFSSLGDILSEELENSGTVEQAEVIGPQLPLGSVGLRRLALWARGRLLSGQADSEPERGGLLNNLSVRLSELGRREEALDAAAEAVSIFRGLSSARPDVFLSSLASSLSNLGNRFGDMARREEALDAAAESVSIRRFLASTRPEIFLPGLANSLNNLGIGFIELGRQEGSSGCGG